MYPLTCVILLINRAHFTHLAHQSPNKSRVATEKASDFRPHFKTPAKTNSNKIILLYRCQKKRTNKRFGVYILAVTTRKFQGFWEEPFVKIPKSERQCRRSVPPPLLYSTLSSLTPHWKITHDLTFSHVSRMSSTSSWFTPRKKIIKQWSVLIPEWII